MNFSQLGFGTFLFKTYGVLMAIAFVFVAWRYYKRIQKHNFPAEYFAHHFWKWLIFGLAIGRIAVLILNPEIFTNHGWFSFLAFWDGEVSLPIFALGFLLFMFFDLRAQQFSFGRWLDLLVEPLLLFLVLENVIAFLTGARYGIATDLFWGVQYETFSVAEVNPVHPVTIYSAIVYLFAWFHYHRHSMANNWKDKVFKGAVFYRAFLLISITEFLLFFIRGDVQKIGESFFSTNQIIFTVSILILLYFKTKVFKIEKRMP